MAVQEYAVRRVGAPLVAGTPSDPLLIPFRDYNIGGALFRQPQRVLDVFTVASPVLRFGSILPANQRCPGILEVVHGMALPYF